MTDRWRTPKDLEGCCFFCGESVVKPGSEPGFEEYVDDVGEFFNTQDQRSYLGHADCLPMGFAATFDDRDPVWKLA